MNKPETPRDAEQRYRILFEANVAAAIVASPEGLIDDCNDAFIQMFGFESRSEVKACTAWDFYFSREDRDTRIDRCRLQGGNVEERCFRHRNGSKIRTKATLTVLSQSHGRPEMLLGTAIDITAQRELESRLRDLSRRVLDLPEEPSSIKPPPSTLENPRFTWMLISALMGLQHRLNQALRPEKLLLFGKQELHDAVEALELMKVLLEEVEVLNLDDSTEQ